MVVFMGGKASGFRNLRDHDTYDVDGTRLFQVVLMQIKFYLDLYKYWISIKYIRKDQHKFGYKHYSIKDLNCNTLNNEPMAAYCGNQGGGHVNV